MESQKIKKRRGGEEEGKDATFESKRGSKKKKTKGKQSRSKVALNGKHDL